MSENMPKNTVDKNEQLETATIAGGCFWCVEAVFKRINGVLSVMPGYSGGDMPNPSYEMVSSGTSGYAEALQIKFDPKIISFPQLLEVFWAVHDPTTLDRQGNDVGPQYRSAVFYHDQQQKEQVEKSIAELKASGKYQNPIVTAIEPFKSFYEAEKEHLDFYDRNREYGYCRLVIDPKIQKLYKQFGSELKAEYQNQ